jgi:hypothetical protein
MNSRDRGLSRRHFLGTLAGTVALPLLGAACRQPYDPAFFSVPQRSVVGLFPAADYAADFADVIYRGFRELGTNLTGRRVFLKPNMVEYEEGTAINTPVRLKSSSARPRGTVATSSISSQPQV